MLLYLPVFTVSLLSIYLQTDSVQYTIEYSDVARLRIVAPVHVDTHLSRLLKR